MAKKELPVIQRIKNLARVTMRDTSGWPFTIFFPGKKGKKDIIGHGKTENEAVIDAYSQGVLKKGEGGVGEREENGD